MLFNPRVVGQAAVPEMDAEAATRTIARPRPETQAVYQAAPVVAAALNPILATSNAL